ncbi:hypothetical protein VPH35_114693 [Triticum aestivum]
MSLNVVKQPGPAEPGRAERAFDWYDAVTVLKKFYSIELDDLTAPHGVEIIDFLEASPSPLPWMTEEELGRCAEKFQKYVFTVSLNYYRMMDTLSGVIRSVKSFGIKHYIERGAFKFSVPDLEAAIIEGHHYLQQEQAERVNPEILSFLKKFSGEEMPK